MNKIMNIMLKNDFIIPDYNNPNIVAERESIEIGQNCHIGQNFKCYSSDFYGIKKKIEIIQKKLKQHLLKLETTYLSEMT